MHADPPLSSDDADNDPLKLPPDPAEREDVINTDVPDSPETDVLTLDGDDFLPQSHRSSHHKA